MLVTESLDRRSQTIVRRSQSNEQTKGWKSREVGAFLKSIEFSIRFRDKTGMIALLELYA